MVRLIRTTEPEIPAVYLKQARDWLRITDSEQDSEIRTLLDAGVNACENYTNRSLITQEWTLYLDSYPYNDHIDLAKGPVSEITSIKTYNTSNVGVVFPATEYVLDFGLVPRVVLKYSRIWPSITTRPRSGVEIVYTAGYGDTPDDVPQGLRTGILLYVAWLYEYREGGATIPDNVRALWDPYAVIEV